MDDGTVFDTRFFNLSDDGDYFCFGVFANYKYFSEIEKYIKELYSFPEILDSSNLKYKEMIENSNSVSIHIRRGDYLEWGIETASESYYRKAIDYMQSKIEAVRFFVFTDDKNYVREKYSNMHNMTIVEGNIGENSFRDMQLMSMCKHNILANSTFSFWGDFLNKNTDKIVIAPNITFGGCQNLFVCDDWVVL